MGKRSNFARRPQDDYPTPREALLPLLPFLSKRRLIVEPCPGEGELVKHLEASGFWVEAAAGDARRDVYPFGPFTFSFVTNPPWTRDILHPIIENLSNQASAWLLFDADWVHCKQAIPLLPRLRAIVSVGRVKWIPGSKFTGKDNAAWHRFERPPRAPIRFYGRKSFTTSNEV